MANNKKRPHKAQARLDARAVARAEAERLKAAQAAKERRTRLLTVAGLVGVAVVAAVVVIVVLVTSKGGAWKDAAPYPPGADKNGGLALGQDMVPGNPVAKGNDVVTVQVYSDYLCPGCAQLEGQIGSQLADMAKAGQIVVETHQVNYLDRLSSGTNYSKRATNAALTVAQEDPEHFWAFHRALFESQPGENEEATAYDQSKIEDVARNAGVSDAAIGKFKDNTMDNWVGYATSQATKAGVSSTPQVWLSIGGKDPQQFEGVGSVDLQTAIDNVRAGKTPDGK